MDVRKVTREVRLSKWAEMIRAQKKSGLGIDAWCAANGVNRHQYFYGQRKLREDMCESLTVQQENRVASPVSFAEVQLPAEPPPTGVITVRIGDAVVEIGGEASPGAIEAVLRSLGQR